MPEGLLGTINRLRAIDAMRRIAVAFGDLADALEGPDPGVTEPLPAVAPVPESRPPVIVAVPATAVVLPPTPAPQPGYGWPTPARLAILRKYWPGYAPSNLILEFMAMQEGPQWASPNAVGVYAVQKLSLKRPADLRTNFDAVQAAARELKADMAAGWLGSAAEATPEADAPGPTLERLATVRSAVRIAPSAPKPVLTTTPAARPTVNGLTAASGPPVIADRAFIQRWGAERGIVTHTLDLDRVNAKRRNLQLPPFEVEEFGRGGARNG